MKTNKLKPVVPIKKKISNKIDINEFPIVGIKA